MKFEHVSIFNGIGFKKKLKAPTDHCFVLKVHDSCIQRCSTEAIYRLLLRTQKKCIYVKIDASPVKDYFAKYYLNSPWLLCTKVMFCASVLHEVIHPSFTSTFTLGSIYSSKVIRAAEKNDVDNSNKRKRNKFIESQVVAGK